MVSWDTVENCVTARVVRGRSFPHAFLHCVDTSEKKRKLSTNSAKQATTSGLFMLRMLVDDVEVGGVSLFRE